MDSANGWTKVTWSKGLGSLNPPTLPSASPKVYALRLRASLFGANAPDPRVLASTTINNFGTGAFVDGDFKKGWKFTIDGQTIHLDNAYPGVLPNSWLVLSKPGYQELYRASTVAELSLTKYAMSGKTTKVDLDTNENIGLFSGASYREVAVFGQSEELPLLAERPLPATQTTGLATSLKLASAVDLPEGRLLLVEGKAVTTGELMAETVTLDHAETANNVTTLHFTTALQRSYLLKHGHDLRQCRRGDAGRDGSGAAGQRRRQQGLPDVHAQTDALDARQRCAGGRRRGVHAADAGERRPVARGVDTLRPRPA